MPAAWATAHNTSCTNASHSSSARHWPFAAVRAKNTLPQKYEADARSVPFCPSITQLLMLRMLKPTCTNRPCSKKDSTRPRAAGRCCSPRHFVAIQQVRPAYCACGHSRPGLPPVDVTASLPPLLAAAGQVHYDQCLYDDYNTCLHERLRLCSFVSTKSCP